MDARPLAVAAAVLIAAALLAWLVRELRRLRASPASYAVVGAISLLAVAAWLLAVTDSVPVWIAWLATVPAVAVSVAPGRLVERTGRRLGTEDLLEEVGRLRFALSTLTTSDLARARLRDRVQALDRWRSGREDASRDELIDLLQTSFGARLDGIAEPLHEVESRDARIAELEQEVRGAHPARRRLGRLLC